MAKISEMTDEQRQLVAAFGEAAGRMVRQLESLIQSIAECEAAGDPTVADVVRADPTYQTLCGVSRGDSTAEVIEKLKALKNSFGGTSYSIIAELE